jgi:hypothetical protein
MHAYIVICAIPSIGSGFFKSERRIFAEKYPIRVAMLSISKSTSICFRASGAARVHNDK